MVLFRNINVVLNMVSTKNLRKQKFFPNYPEMEINRKMRKLAERKEHPFHSSLTRIEKESICSSHRTHNGIIQLPRINTSQVVTEEFGFIDAEQERSRGDGPVGKVFATQAEGCKCVPQNLHQKSCMDF